MRFLNPLILATILLVIQKGESISGITIDSAGTCQGIIGGKIQAALVDMGNMARFTYDCTNAWATGTQSQCNPTVFLSTFQAYFGSITNRAVAGRGQTLLCMCVSHLGFKY